MKALVTGGAGFIGHYLVNRILTHTDWDVVILDKLSYAARGLDRLREIGAFGNPRIKILTADLIQPISAGIDREIGYPDYVFHLAAESHVDNSVKDPLQFVYSNVIGTANLLEHFKNRSALFIHFSTDEVFGPALEAQSFRVNAGQMPTNPYSASKSAAEKLVLAWAKTYGMQIKIVRCNNVFGKRQHPEKFIPLVIKKLLQDEIIQVHTAPDGTMGSRVYIYAGDVAEILIMIAKSNINRTIEHIVGLYEVGNSKMVELIAAEMDIVAKVELITFDLGQSSHDLRYEIEPTVNPEIDRFYDQLNATILWASTHKEWLEWK